MIIGIGTDIVQISRFEKIINSSYKSRLDKFFSIHEIEYCYKNAANDKIIAGKLAARFAAKEAFVKALGTGFGQGIYLSGIEITVNQIGKPFIKLDTKLQNIVNNFFYNKNFQILLSLSHDYPIASAFVIIQHLR